MAFDYQGPGFSNYTGHNSNVYPSKSNPRTTDFNTAQAIDYYKSQITSPRKIILGMPLYGRSFANTAGLGMGSRRPRLQSPSSQWQYRVHG
jgi:chitinase